MKKCRVCKWEGEAECLTVREMMDGTGDEFNYFICPMCHCLQIKEIPDEMEMFYSNNYYSFEKPDTTSNDTKEKNEIRILDVGCGVGRWLCAMAQQGYTNLYGCDPYIQADLHYENGVQIYKKTIHEMEGKFDRIFLNDSFEHMWDPHAVMESIVRLLSPNGLVQISLPIFPNIAYDTFGVNWYQLDAPRHIVLYSREGIELLAHQYNLDIIHVVYDGNNSSLIKSYLYEQNIPFKEQTTEMIAQYFGAEDIDKFTKYAAQANEKGYGDHAMFWLTHSKIPNETN